MTDCVIIGGGVIGLSIARELAGRSHRVRVLAREPRENVASWAAVGIFPPAPEYPGMTPGEALTAWSDRLHAIWSRELLEETGIDNGLHRCGGLHVATNEADLPRLVAQAGEWRNRNARCELLDAAVLAAIEPALGIAVQRGAVLGGMLLADEQQFRSPRHLRALEHSCLSRGARIERGTDVTSLDMAGGRVTGLRAVVNGSPERIEADAYVLAAGAWSGPLARCLGVALDTRPIRGQIALLRPSGMPLGRIVNRGLDYLVPRDDGQVLVGSTLEDVGFEPTTTEEAITRLKKFAIELLGNSADVPLERAWAGLRPGTLDGLPTIGRIPGLENAFIAAGHFRAGLHQSTGTAVLMADLVTAAPPSFDPAPFSLERRQQAGNAPAPGSIAELLGRVATEHP